MRMRSASWTILLLLPLLLLCTPGGDALLVPDQLVSFIHILYSSIPVIRKGTDSRVGFGFRFGPHADAQVLLELGPQKRTAPLTEVTTPKQTLFGDPSKRHVPGGDPLGDHAAVGDLDDNHIQGRAFGGSSVVAPGLSDGGGVRGGEWLTRWRSGWAAPSPPPARPSRGPRIALAPWTSSAASQSTAQPEVQPVPSFGGASSTAAREDPQSPSPRRSRAERPPMTTSGPAPGALHLRDVMAGLSRTTARTPTTRTPSSSPPRGRTPPPPLFQGGLLRALRQLWEAGARAANQT